MEITFKNIVDSLTVPTFVLNKDHEVVAWNRACENLTGVKAEDIIGTKEAWRGFYDQPRPCLADFVIDEKATDSESWYSIASRAKYGIGQHAEAWFPNLNGKKAYLMIDAEPMFDADGELIAVVENLEDITDIKVVEDRLRLSDKVFTYTNQSILITDAKRRIVQVNQSFTRLTGYELTEITGENPSILQSGKHGVDFYRDMNASIQTTGHWEGEIWDRRKDGTIYPKWMTIDVVNDPKSGNVTHYIAIFSDITERKKNEEEIRRLAFHDPLTDLPNRALFHDRLDQAISESHRRESKFALLFIDLDRFKIVNDTSGHHVGDLLLKEVASRLTSTVRESDTVARLGGDEFVIILQEIEHATDVSKVAAKIIDKLNQPFLIEGHELHTPPSIGISMYPIDATDSEGLILAADTAMYHVKEHGKNDYQYFTYAMTEVAHARAQLEQELRVALEQKQFELHFQPKISLEPERVSGCEVLLRWKHPQRGYIPPDQFIPIAEEAGVILAIGEWILDETAKQVSIWRDQGLHDLTVAINLSPVQFRDESLSSKIEECVQRSTLAAHKVELEITENIFMDTIEDSVDGLTLMKSLGVCLAIDDFGTGYSSLSYLKRFDVNTLKIDKSFVSDIDTKPDGAAIVAAIISLAHNLGLTVVAEGVETKAQLDYLHSLTCDEFQGYYFSKPLPADAFYDFVMAFNKDLCENSEK